MLASLLPQPGHFICWLSTKASSRAMVSLGSVVVIVPPWCEVGTLCRVRPCRRTTSMSHPRPGTGWAPRRGGAALASRSPRPPALVDDRDLAHGWAHRPDVHLEVDDDHGDT